jgi:hypothetical protein
MSTRWGADLLQVGLVRAGSVGSPPICRIPGLIVALVALALLAAGCAGGEEAQRPDRPASPFGVLRSSPSDGDGLPAWVIGDMRRSDRAAFASLDLTGARRVLGRRRAWLLPMAPKGLCLVQVVRPLVAEFHGKALPPTVGQICLPEHAVEIGELRQSRSLSTTFTTHLRTLVEGIVPDGVRSVTVHFEHHSSERVPVTRNSYEATVVNPHSVSFSVSTDGHRRDRVVSIASAAGARPRPARLRSE